MSCAAAIRSTTSLSFAEARRGGWKGIRRGGCRGTIAKRWSKPRWPTRHDRDRTPKGFLMVVKDKIQQARGMPVMPGCATLVRSNHDQSGASGGRTLGKQIHVGRVALYECQSCGHLWPTRRRTSQSGAQRQHGNPAVPRPTALKSTRIFLFRWAYACLPDAHYPPQIRHQDWTKARFQKAAERHPTVTSADAVPPVTVTCPGASALRMGGSSVERLTTVGSLDAQVNPVTGCP